MFFVDCYSIAGSYHLLPLRWHLGIHIHRRMRTCEIAPTLPARVERCEQKRFVTKIRESPPSPPLTSFFYYYRCVFAGCFFNSCGDLFEFCCYSLVFVLTVG